MTDASASSMEIERKFLLKDLPPGLEACRSVCIRQGYLVQGEGREIRVREKDSRWWLTVKIGAGLSRHEVEVALSSEQGEALWPLTEGRRIQKTRYLYPLETDTAEIDVFEGDLSGLRLCEIEFSAEDAARSFDPPDFLGREVTEDPGYKNAELARHGMPTP